MDSASSPARIRTTAFLSPRDTDWQNGLKRVAGQGKCSRVVTTLLWWLVQSLAGLQGSVKLHWTAGRSGRLGEVL